jgi:signal transduction histidine kinase
MTDEGDRLAELSHALANPLSAILAEAQLLLMGDVALDEETRNGLREVEKLALRMRMILRESRGGGSPPANSPAEETR